MKALTGQQNDNTNALRAGGYKETKTNDGVNITTVRTPVGQNSQNTSSNKQGGTNNVAMPGVQPNQGNKKNKGKMPGVQ